MDNIAYLKEIISQYTPTITDPQIERLITFYELLIENNKVMNLTAITDFEEVVVKHFADSLALSYVYDLNEKKNILDIGTGAGFPGMPLGIAYPDVRITLLDSLGKRVNFLNEVIETLGLDNVTAVNARAEDYIREGHREEYDLAVSRAVASLNVLSEYALPAVRVGASFVAYKSENVDEEISQAARAIEILGGEVERVMTFSLPATSPRSSQNNIDISSIKRSLILIRKIHNTPEKYPRRAGMASKRPL